MLTRLGFPRVGEHRRFVAAIVADTVGSGLFMPITLLYFLAMTDLSLVQVGSALSLSARADDAGVRSSSAASSTGSARGR